MKLWIRRCRGGKQSRAGAFTRLFGVLKLAGGCHFNYVFVPGVLSD